VFGRTCSNGGVRFDFQYISDNLTNVESDRNDRFVSWDRVRGTVDIDFGALIVVQYYANVGGGSESAVVVGFRTKVEF